MEEPESVPGGEEELLPLNLRVSPDLYRAYQRCAWIIVNQTGRDQLSVMEEMVRDFLVKHGC